MNVVSLTLRMVPHTPLWTVTRARRALLALTAVAAVFPLSSGCNKVPLLAPSGTVINLFVSSTVLSLNSSTDITAVLIESGAASTGTGTGGTTTPGAGIPVQNGTVVDFTTTIGTIEPAEARTINGQVTVKLISGTTSGTAIVTAYSGG